MIDYAQHLGIASVSLLAIGLAIIPVKWPYSIKHTFSQHIARYRASIIYYIILFSVFLPLFLIFFGGWFVPHFQLPLYVLVLMGVVAFLQLACTLIPELPGWRREWHRALAGLSAFGLMPIVASLLFIPSTLIQVLVIISLALMIILPIIFLGHSKRLGESYIIQTLYYAAFFIPILVVTYAL